MSLLLESTLSGPTGRSNRRPHRCYPPPKHGNTVRSACCQRQRRRRERPVSTQTSASPRLEPAALGDWNPRVARERRVTLRASAVREDRSAAVRDELLVDAGVAEAGWRRRGCDGRLRSGHIAATILFEACRRSRASSAS